MAAARARRRDDAHEDKRQGEGGKRPRQRRRREISFPEGEGLLAELDGHIGTKFQRRRQQARILAAARARSNDSPHCGEERASGTSGANERGENSTGGTAERKSPPEGRVPPAKHDGHSGAKFWRRQGGARQNSPRTTARRWRPGGQAPTRGGITPPQQRGGKTPRTATRWWRQEGRLKRKGGELPPQRRREKFFPEERRSARGARLSYRRLHQPGKKNLPPRG